MHLSRDVITSSSSSLTFVFHYILVKKHSDETITKRRDLWKACKITRIRTDAHCHLRSVSDKESERCFFFIAF